MSGADFTAETTLARTGEPVRASVCAGGVETDYVRVGRGVPVLLLAAPDDPDRDTLLRSLGAQARVIAPRIPAGVDFASWLRDFLDGVGVLPVRIVATGALVTPALEFAAADPSRVERVTIGEAATQRNQTTDNIAP